MRSINTVILVGHVANDPETTPTKSGKQRVTFPLATHREATSEGVKKEVTDYHRIVAWGKLGEIVAKHVTKGTALYVQGSLLNRAYEVDGEKRYTTEVRADTINILTWKKQDGVNTVNLEDPAAVPTPDA